MDATEEFNERIAAEKRKDHMRHRGRVAHPQMTHCERCGATGGRLERHHPDLLNKPTEVIVLCVPCHKAEHKGKRPPRESLPLPAAVNSVYLKATEAAAYLRFTSYASFRTFRSRHGLPKGIKVGKRLLFTKQQLDEAMAQLAERRPGPARIRVR